MRSKSFLQRSIACLLHVSPLQRTPILITLLDHISSCHLCTSISEGRYMEPVCTLSTEIHPSIIFLVVRVCLIMWVGIHSPYTQQSGPQDFQIIDVNCGQVKMYCTTEFHLIIEVLVISLVSFS